ncbi:hypothetical protein JTB14_033737 [Gonioctena quinquepunctata]|nr:hypothetical protein JTB14_033737 [Gonioctena quinquepunctata]
MFHYQGGECIGRRAKMYITNWYHYLCDETDSKKFGASCMHDNDNLPEVDKLGKVIPLIERINQNFIWYATIEPNISIDESMKPYYGRNGCKQYIKGKPIRFGYKAWVAALKSGYCLAFDIYQGKKKSTMGLGKSVVTNFANLLENKLYRSKVFILF